MAHPLQPGRLALGTATASFQIEGSATADGRGPSIWDTFCEVPGAVRDGSDGTRACDSYLRWEEDVDLVAGLNVEWYRFSLAWPRLMPEGTGRLEPRGLAYYDRLVDTLLARGIRPTATLYHWDLPQPLEDAGGWPERATAEAFAAYGAAVHARLGDRVELWASHNEPWCAAYLGYAAGVHAPGRREGGAAHRAAHHLMLGHGLLRQAIGDVEGLGIVCNLAPVWPETPEAAPLADRLDAVRNRVWLDPLVDGAYDDVLLDVAPELADPTVVRDGDLALIHGSADWLGINYYTPIRPALGTGGSEHPEGAAYPGVGDLDLVVRDPRTDIGWEIAAEGLEELLVQVHRRTGLPLVVTENGAAMADRERDAAGVVDDQDRIAYLRDHLAATDAAIASGADVRGYFVWTLLDNFEWAEGYTKTFGLVHVDRDHDDLPRVPKASYHWVADEAVRRGSSFRGVAGADGA
ncbi:GH1 family beta-glucosidase [Nocardioides sp.]|uniref:GH1 family beta-glucosidase n=1 Tax=Nocardioides sp. TaxID=35761 RepID=UPI003516138D